MQTGRAENRGPSQENRHQTTSKKQPHRIHIISKFNKNQPQTYQSQQLQNDIMPLRRTYTTGYEISKNSEAQLGLVRLRQQVQIIRAQYQQRFDLKMKQNSIEINRLQMRIQSNNQLLAKKDAIILQLSSKINQLKRSTSQLAINPYSSQQSIKSPRNSTIDRDKLHHKINEIEQKNRHIKQVQKVQNRKMQQISKKIDIIQNNLVMVLGTRISKIFQKVQILQNSTQQRICLIFQKIDSIVQKFTKSITDHQNNGANCDRKIQEFINQIQLHRKTIQKMGMINLQQNFNKINNNLNQLTQKVSSLKQQIVLLQNKGNALKQSDYIQTVNNSGSFCSSKQFQQNVSFYSKTPKRQNLSCLFDDYEQVFEELDSICDDKFFHPLDSSFQKPSSTPQKGNKPNKGILTLRSPGSSQGGLQKVNQEQYITAKFQSAKKNYPSSLKKNTHSYKNINQQSFEQFQSEEENDINTNQLSQLNEGVQHKNPTSATVFDNSNQIRFIATMKYYRKQLPVALEVDINGMVKLRGQIKYLVDPNNKFFVFSDYQLRRLREAHYIQ